MKTNGSLIATLGRTGSGVFQAVKGRIWSGYTPTTHEVAGAGTPTIRSMAGAPTLRSMAGTPIIRQV